MKIKYEVYKYFDTYPDGLVYSGLDEEKAKEICNQKNETVRNLPKTKFIIRKKEVNA